MQFSYLDSKTWIRVLY